MDKKSSYILQKWHDSSEIIVLCWFGAQETFVIVINVENSCDAQYFLKHYTLDDIWLLLVLSLVAQ